MKITDDEARIRAWVEMKNPRYDDRDLLVLLGIIDAERSDATRRLNEARAKVSELAVKLGEARADALREFKRSGGQYAV
jgi:hypothetical protein